MNHFGGNWTEAKIEILVEYARAYLQIMNKFADRYNWKLIYFDGFAGSGYIKKGNKENEKIIIGAAKRILEIAEPRSFDNYYFVEKEQNNALGLKELTAGITDKTIQIITEDCNTKIVSLGHFLKTARGKNYKVLAYIDPCGMQLKWDALVSLKESKVDAWILVPTGMGVNRLLQNDGRISKAWIQKLETFLGMKESEIVSYFYNEQKVLTLFGEESVMIKEKDAIKKSAELYQARLNSLFDFVSKPYVLKNKSNSTMFHFYMVTNNKNAVKIANEIIKKYNSKG
ncbi:three-Cys-motif partner protein TcmP [Roseivirga sp.]|uniref:three-Cys-motif partner protein TcmP n=1 Tax=Roseivirga sp. TaxID=1964215 RepID=UPI002B27A97C|nr:three-Cys-motif partner protein TcmP [Roseivirga sp.]